MRDLLYHPYYCEENVWQLLGRPEWAGRAACAVVISNRWKTCALWSQRAAEAGHPVIWDYHVIALARSAVGWDVWDFDTRLGMPVGAADYLAGTFPPEKVGEVAGWESMFRVVPAQAYLATFSSDRSHMEGTPHPPPPWPPIRRGAETMNLWRFVDMQTPFVGDVLSLGELTRRFAG